MEKQDTSNGCNISFGKGEVTGFNPAGKYTEEKRQNDTKAFQSKYGIILD